MVFTYENYSNTLKRYKESGYSVLSFRDFLETSPKKAVVLRHDIDLNLEAAFRIADLDAQAGVTSTFFIRMHATGYNPLTLESMRMLREISKMGHELGAHFEPGMAHAMGRDPLEVAAEQKHVFELMFGQRFIGMSTHEPARADNPNLVDQVCKLWDLKYHAYEDRFIRDMKYISDSGGRWREGCFSEWVGKHDRMQVLVHPFWWYSQYPQENY